MENHKFQPDYLFEVSWEVCNKVGGIHTVISTKALTLSEMFGIKYLLVGPDVWRESGPHPEFTEESGLFHNWKQKAQAEGLNIKTGFWKIPGDPMVILVDFTPYFHKKNEIFSELWENYKLDSISGQWDYVEPALFGYAAGKVIESFIKFHMEAQQKAVAQFHEWMTGGGLLYLKKNVPQIGTVFVTHATAVGRSIAGNLLPLYSKMEEYSGDAKASDFNITSKHSLEKLSAQHADAFTTVSLITARECTHFLGKDVDIVTPNGFEDNFIPQGAAFGDKRKQARADLIQVANALLGEKFSDDVILIGTSGRYEFRNKGIDIYLDALGHVNTHYKGEKNILAFVFIPAGHYGPRKDLKEILGDSSKRNEGNPYLTHGLHYEEHDEIINRVIADGFHNTKNEKVKVIYVPSYLNGDDGIFNKTYYDILIGLDLTIFPSYYEPWGYTPMESIAFRIPTITTSLAGFGAWVTKEYKDSEDAVMVVERGDTNDNEVIEKISRRIREFLELSEKQRKDISEKAFEISKNLLWGKLIEHYKEAFHLALIKAHRLAPGLIEKEPLEEIPAFEQLLLSSSPVWKRLIVQKNIPEKLKHLEELSRNLWWSWNQDAIELFNSIDPSLWVECSENPMEFLERISYNRLVKLENDEAFLEKLHSVYHRFEEYIHAEISESQPQIAYFSMEFGLHSSLRTYSGGLGLLAGDYLKEASDCKSKIFGISLFYRYGYFKQQLTANGEQIAINELQDFSKTPAQPVRDSDGNWVTIKVVFPGRNVYARVWKVDVGRVPLYLLDTDFEANQDKDRHITHLLYGGDNEYRLKQELLLGIGGIRAIRAINLDPDLYHCNEGHAAFIGLERMREFIQEQNMTFNEALEVVRASSLFTTHTPVPAGHDYFDEDLIRKYIAHYPSRMKTSWSQLMSLGRMHPEDIHERFSMSCLAVNLSQEVNGVSRLHGKESRKMFSAMWKAYMADELHISYVTNGVHLPTWLSASWKKLFHEELGPEFMGCQFKREVWQKVHDIDDQRIWDIRNQERKGLIEYIKNVVYANQIKRHENPREILEAREKLDEKTLTIGFARRFATYKRAHLLFKDLNRLNEIMNNPEMPVQIIFAGKAHPNDKAGQDLIKRITEVSRSPEFIGKIVFLPNYDIDLAKKMLHGVDVWLNTPTRPLEASGTSGQKAVMNGVLHFSVLDGWWAEGYREGAGWALPEERTYENQNFQDELDVEVIYNLLESEIASKFYHRNSQGIPEEWVQVIKKSVSSIAPEFTMNRMLKDYYDKFYYKLHDRIKMLKENDYRKVREISFWKKKIMFAWDDIKVISVTLPDISKETIVLGKEYTGEVVLDLGTLAPEEIGVELIIIDTESENAHPNIIFSQEYEYVSTQDRMVNYRIELAPTRTGSYDLGIRVFPKHPLLPHRMDFSLVKWV